MESGLTAESIDRVASVQTAPSRWDRKRERTRAEVYSAAMNLFLRRSFEAVTIEEICDGANVVRGVVKRKPADISYPAMPPA